MCIDINECASSPCQHGSSCINRQNGYTCACAPGYEGVHCQIGNAPLNAPLGGLLGEFDNKYWNESNAIL